MKLAGKLLSVMDCSEILFNDTTQPAYKRTMRLIREAKLDTVKLGRVTYVSRALLYKHFKLEDEEKGSDAPLVTTDQESIVIHLPKR